MHKHHGSGRGRGLHSSQVPIEVTVEAAEGHKYLDARVARSGKLFDLGDALVVGCQQNRVLEIVNDRVGISISVIAFEPSLHLLTWLWERHIANRRYPASSSRPSPDLEVIDPPPAIGPRAWCRQVDVRVDATR